MAYPTIVAFDLDGTVWSNWLDPDKFGFEKDLEIVDNVIRNRWSPRQYVRVSPDIGQIIDDLTQHNVTIAIVSRNMNPRLCNRAMWLIRVLNMPMIEVVTYVEMTIRSKCTLRESIGGVAPSTTKCSISTTKL